MDWLFIATKPSFIYGKPFLHTFLVLIRSIPAAVIFFALALIPLIAGRILLIPTALMARILGSLVFGTTLYLLLNNFTYTLFSFGPLTVYGAERLGFIVIYFALIAYAFRLISSLGRPNEIIQIGDRLLAGVLIFAILTLCVFAFNYNSSPAVSIGTNSSTKERKDFPNIFIISSDAVNADHLSLYGYHRPTTPFLDSIASDFTIFENAFANANRSASSLMSMLTGKDAGEIGVLTDEQILLGEHSYQHLPGILRGLGYRSLELSETDSYVHNMRYGFDKSTYSHTNNLIHRYLLKFPHFYNSEEFYFLTLISRRLSDILLHTFGVKTVRNLYFDLTGGFNDLDTQNRQIKHAQNFIKQSSEPFFLHLHLLGTHGPYYNTINHVFASDDTNVGQRDINLYDDAILDFDDNLKKLVSTLQAENKWNKTLFIIHSDHGQTYDPILRVPLLMHFPGKQTKERISQNVQLLDIAPTVLDLVGTTIPQWMTGKSLLSGEIDPLRSIMAAADGYPNNFIFRTDSPFYNIESVSVTYCNLHYRWFLRENRMVSGNVYNHTSPCPSESLPTVEQAKEKIVKSLISWGIDTSTLPE
jgi:hypothetical protein